MWASPPAECFADTVIYPDQSVRSRSKQKKPEVLHMQIKLIQDMSELPILLIYKAWGEKKQTSEYCLLTDFWDI